MSERRKSINAGEMKDGDTKWIDIQKKTFTKWLNNHLSRKNFPTLNVLEEEFTDGINLMHIVNALYNVPIPKYKKDPKLTAHKIDNINLALEMVEKAKIKTNFLKNTHLLDKDLKMILGMAWSIILDYAIKGISEGDSTAKEGLLLWVQKKTQNYKHVDPPKVRNFTTDWRNGLALCALIHRHMPQLINYDSLEPKNAVENITMAFDIAEKELGIPRLLDVEDLTTERPDERAVMTYVSEFFHRFAGQGQKEIAARRAANFAKFARSMFERQNDYERRAKSLVDWADGAIRGFSEFKFGETLEEAKTASDGLRAFIVGEQPPKVGEKIDVENLLAEIQTELKINGRAPYQPPHELTLESVENMFDRLNEASRKFALDVRENRFRFIKKAEHGIPPEKMQEIKDSFSHFDHDKNGHMDRDEFKAACVALDVPFTDDKTFEETFTRIATDGTVDEASYTKYMCSLSEDKDTPEQIKESFKLLADGRDIVTAQQLATPPLDADDAAFLGDMMDKKENGFDYNSYVDFVFNGV